jgi:Mn-dependent DtxR family transcriptional regulator
LPLIASMLGVGRETITETARNLQRTDLISYRRGHIMVLDRSELESRICECYAVVKTNSIVCCAMYVIARNFP